MEISTKNTKLAGAISYDITPPSPLNTLFNVNAIALENDRSSGSNGHHKGRSAEIKQIMPVSELAHTLMLADVPEKDALNFCERIKKDLTFISQSSVIAMSNPFEHIWKLASIGVMFKMVSVFNPTSFNPSLSVITGSIIFGCALYSLLISIKPSGLKEIGSNDLLSSYKTELGNLISEHSPAEQRSGNRVRAKKIFENTTKEFLQSERKIFNNGIAKLFFYNSAVAYVGMMIPNEFTIDTIATLGLLYVSSEVICYKTVDKMRSLIDETAQILTNKKLTS